MFTRNNLMTFKNGSLLTNTSTTTPDDSESSHYTIGGGRIFTVNLIKEENIGFGFLIKQKDEMPYFSIWEIIENGPAEQSGKMKKGDIILKVNDYDLTSYDYEKGLDFLRSIRN